MANTIFFLLMAAFVQDLVYPIANTGFVGLTIQNVVLYCAAVVLIAAAASSGRLGAIRFPGLTYLLLIFLGVVVSLVYVSYSGAVPFTWLENARTAKTLIFEPILLYSVSFLLIRNEEQGLRYLSIFLVILALVNVFSLVISVFNINLPNMNAHYFDKGRFAGFAGNPNKTAYVLCIAFAYLYFFMKQTRKRRLRVFYVALLASIPLTILLTGSRGGLLGLIIVAVLLARLWGDYKSLVILPAVVVPIVIVLLVAMENDYMLHALDRFMLFGAADATTVSSSRTDIWLALLDVWSSSFTSIVIGIGYGVSQFVGFGARAHNMYLQMLVEFGVVGLLIWLAGIWGARRFLIRYRAAGVRRGLLRRTTLACLYVLMVAWVFTSLINVLGIIALIFGLVTAALIQKPATRRATRRAVGQSPNEQLLRADSTSR